ncbi:MAG: AIR synthase-related protein [Coriobacteriia bacterium]|nr:AIR synthase-related protein [Coriobacteriia bacterium]
MQRAVVEAIRAGVASSAHDCSEGGLGIALAECCLAGGIGASVFLPDDLAPAVSLFSETQSRIVVTCAPERADALVAICDAHQVPFSVIGTVGGDALTFNDEIRFPLGRLREAYEGTLPRYVGSAEAVAGAPE